MVCFQEAGILGEFGQGVKENLGTTAWAMTRDNSHGIDGDTARGIHGKAPPPYLRVEWYAVCLSFCIYEKSIKIPIPDDDKYLGS
jgi:hypothetical protein